MSWSPLRGDAAPRLGEACTCSRVDIADWPNGMPGDISIMLAWG